jgi:hypothetical protein
VNDGVRPSTGVVDAVDSDELLILVLASEGLTRTVARRTLPARQAGTVRARLRPLRPGRYRVSVRARDAAGNRSPVIRRRARVK